MHGVVDAPLPVSSHSGASSMAGIEGDAEKATHTNGGGVSGVYRDGLTLYMLNYLNFDPYMGK